MDEIKGTVEEIIYRNDDNGYTVVSLEDKQTGDELVATGLLPMIREGEYLSMTGQWTQHKIYGDQFKVNSYRVIPPDSRTSLIRYLGSGAIKGVGLTTAQNIVDTLGLQALDILREHPESIRQVKGIGDARADVIIQSISDQFETQEVMLFLQSCSISANLSAKILKKYGRLTRKIVELDPYALVTDIEGIGFLTADRIASTLGTEPGSNKRVDAGIGYVLRNVSARQGHTCLPVASLMELTARLLMVEQHLVQRRIDALAAVSKIILEERDGDQFAYLYTFYRSEHTVAAAFAAMSQLEYTHLFEDPLGAIQEVSRRNQITLSPEQIDAVHSTVSNGVTVVTGGPGTGKTMAISCMIGLLEMAGVDVLLAAPTGRAAKRITEATGYEAKTIHRLLEYGFSGEDELQFQRNRENPLECGALIIDEVSMVDISLMECVLDALPLGCRLVLVGDVDQLPSVGPGNVLRDIIAGNMAHVVFLTQIFRQAEESQIVVNAHKVNHGLMPDLAQKQGDFFFERKANTQDALTAVVELVKQRIPNYLHCDPLTDIQILTPMKKGELGVYYLNRVLQDVLNPMDQEKNKTIYGDVEYREGDKVMQTRNNYSIEWRRRSTMQAEETGKGIFNGDIGYIQQVDTQSRMITVCFDDGRVVDYEFSQLDELMLSYAISVHKSQGSEYNVVILPLMSGPPLLLTRNLLYTAITRAKNMVVILGNADCIRSMVNNNTVQHRYTGLISAFKRICAARENGV